MSSANKLTLYVSSAKLKDASKEVADITTPTRADFGDNWREHWRELTRTILARGRGCLASRHHFHLFALAAVVTRTCPSLARDLELICA